MAVGFCIHTPAAEKVVPVEVVFADATAAAGLDFVHFNGMTGEFYLPEEMGAGLALLDYDGDGDLDIYFVQGNLLGPKAKAERALIPPPGSLPLSDRLYRNDLLPGGNKDCTPCFRDVTDSAGIRVIDYGMGAAVGDIDNDGFPDIYVANYGPNRLLRNRGDGTFEEVGKQSGTADPRWSVSAAFFDYDRDGDQDLYVANYLRYDLDEHQSCITPSGRRDYCGPNTYPDSPDRLYRNRGDGTFEDVSTAAGIGKASGSGLGVVVADLNGDRWLDLYVANDADANLLWINRRDGTFSEDGLMAGCAFNAHGNTEAGMGVDCGDFDNDGDLDLFVTHLTHESHTLYVQGPAGTFADRTASLGLHRPTLEATGFGTGFLDYDGDGLLDLFAVNGTVMAVASLLLAGDNYPLKQTNQLFRNKDGSGFELVRGAVPAFDLLEVSRGAAVGDIDNDGDEDIVVSNNAGPARLLLNQVGNRVRWVGVTARPGPGKPPEAGTLLTLERRREDGGPATPLLRRVRIDGSYACAGDSRVLFGLGSDSIPLRLRVQWADGTVESRALTAFNRYHVITKGKGPEP